MHMNELRIGTLLQGGKYKIEKTLGQGGFGITYLAEQTNLNRKVCIKEFFMKEYGERTESNVDNEATVLTAVTSTAGEIMERYRDKFIKEAKTIARLDHPGIVRIHDVFEENGTAYYVMDYIEGENLNEKVKREGPLSEDRALGYIQQVADALSYVHNHNIMHLDVKPSNIIIRKSDDRAILIDFGAAKQYDSTGTQTSTTPIGISAGYAPIELMKVGGVQTFSPETDVYSLGATLYYLVTGQNPPDASDVLEDGLPEMPTWLSSSLRNAVSEAMKTRKQRPKNVDTFIGLIDTGKLSPEKEDTIRKEADGAAVIQEGPKETVQLERERTNADYEPVEEKKKEINKESNEGNQKQRFVLWGILGAVIIVLVLALIMIPRGQNYSNSSPYPQSQNSPVSSSKPLLFQGVPITGSPSAFGAGLVKAGLKSTGNGTYIGRFFGYDGCIVTPVGNPVWQVRVDYPVISDWNALEKAYDTIMEWYTSTYNNPKTSANSNLAVYELDNGTISLDADVKDRSTWHVIEIYTSTP